MYLIVYDIEQRFPTLEGVSELPVKLLKNKQTGDSPPHTELESPGITFVSVIFKSIVVIMIHKNGSNLNEITESGIHFNIISACIYAFIHTYT